MNTILRWTMPGILGLCASAGAWSADTTALPPMKKQATPEKVLAEHLDAVEKSDWNRLVAQFPENGEVHLLDGQVARDARRSANCSSVS